MGSTLPRRILDPNAQFLETIAEITPDIEAMAGGAASELSRGGMRTKIDAGKIATGAGCAMIIASGKVDHPLSAIGEGARSSWFAPSGSPVTARKTLGLPDSCCRQVALPSTPAPKRRSVPARACFRPVSAR